MKAIDQEKIASLRRKIAKGELKPVIHELSAMDLHGQLGREALAIASQFGILQSEIGQGIVTNEQRAIRQNQISASVISILDRMRTETPRQAPKWAWRVVLAVGVIGFLAMIIGWATVELGDENQTDPLRPDTTKVDCSYVNPKIPETVTSSAGPRESGSTPELGSSPRETPPPKIDTTGYSRFEAPFTLAGMVIDSAAWWEEGILRPVPEIPVLAMAHGLHQPITLDVTDQAGRFELRFAPAAMIPLQIILDGSAKGYRSTSTVFSKSQDSITLLIKK